MVTRLTKGMAHEIARMGHVGTPMAMTGNRLALRKFAVQRDNLGGLRATAWDVVMMMMMSEALD